MVAYHGPEQKREDGKKQRDEQRNREEERVQKQDSTGTEPEISRSNIFYFFKA